METKCWVPNQSTNWTTNQPTNPMTQQLVYRLTHIPTNLPAASWQIISLTDTLLDHPANWPSYTLTDSCTHQLTYLLTNSPSDPLTPCQLLTNQPTNWPTEWLANQARNSPCLMDPESLLPCSWGPTTCSFPGTDESSPSSPILFHLCTF